MNIRLLALCLILSGLAAGEAPWLLPADATTGDVVRDFGAKGDGLADDTAAIQAALSDGKRIVYLPPGTYCISATLRWGPGEKRQTLQGAGPEHTRLRLIDRAPGFTDPAKPRAMIWTGTAPAQRFRNGLRSLTIETGAGNPGAIGAQFITSNQGGISDVVFRSGAPTGPIGLDLGYSDEQGPILVQRVRIEGFAVGIDLKGSVNSATFEHISLAGQSEVGLRNRGQCISIRGLDSDNRVTALDNGDTWSTATLLDSRLRGGSADVPAIINAGVLFARRVDTAGYGPAIAERNGPGHGPGLVREYTSQPVQALFPTAPARSLDLPVEETPTAPWPAVGDWISITAFAPRKLDLPGRTNADGSAAKGEAGRPRTVTDWSLAFQQAIDSGKPVVYIPNGTYEMHGAVEIRGAVRRIIGFESEFGRWGQLELSTGATTGPVRVERFDWMYNHLVINHRGSHALTLATVIKGCEYGRMVKVANSGDLFFEDVSLHPGGSIELQGGRTFARQLNTEGGNRQPAMGTRDSIDEGEVENLLNRGGQLWILGLKTENDATLISTIAGGKTEVVGGLCYANKAYRPEKQWFVSIDSDLSFTLGENVMRNAPFDPVVERRAGETRVYPKGRQVVRGSGSAIALFSGWRNPATAAPSVSVTGLTATPTGTDSIRLDWTPPAAAGLDGLALEMAVGSAPFELVTVLPPAAKTYRLTRLAAGTAYRLRLSAANGAGIGPAIELVGSTNAAAAVGNGTGLRGRQWTDSSRRTALGQPTVGAVVSAAAKGVAVRWSGTITARFDETYRLGTGVRGCRIWIDGRLILDLPPDARHATAGGVALRAGQATPIVVEAVLFEKSALSLTWASASQAEEPVPLAQLHPDDDEPSGFAVSFPTTAKEGDALVITVRRDGPVVSASEVPLRASGDWATLGLTAPKLVAIPTGASEAQVRVTLTNDQRPGPERRLGLAVAPGPGHLVRDAAANCLVADDDTPAPGTGTGLVGSYFAKPSVSGQPLGSRLDPRIEFAWNDRSPFKGITLDPDAKGPDVGFAASWSGSIASRFSEEHTLMVVIGPYTTASVWIGDILVIDARDASAPKRGVINLVAGKRVPVRVEMVHKRAYGAGIRLLWSSASQWEEVVPATQWYAP